MQFAPTSIVKQYITRQYVSCKLKNVIHSLNIKLPHGGECNSTLQQYIARQYINPE
jgi:hypothetical protein